MESKNRVKLLVSVLAIVIAFAVFIKPLASTVKQGLDLQGGTHVVLQAQETPESKVDDDAINRSIQIIERRVNELGLTEPVIQRQGKDKIIVELPGVKDPEQAIAMLGKTAMLEFKDMDGNTVLTGKDLKDSKASADQSGQPVVTLQFNEEGAKKFADLTARNVGRPSCWTATCSPLPGSANPLPGAMPRSPGPRTPRKRNIWPSSCAAALCR